MTGGEARDAYLDKVLVGGREPLAVVTLLDYDPSWVDRFAELHHEISMALRSVALSVQHIGSTAVPGLVAKPIVDVLLTVSHISDEAAYRLPLERAGFGLRVLGSDHRMFRTGARDAHIHVYEPTNQAVQDYLDFRDWLRVDLASRQLYGVTKRQLAQRMWSDRNDYAAAKSEVIQELLARARHPRQAIDLTTKSL